MYVEIHSVSSVTLENPLNTSRKLLSMNIEIHSVSSITLENQTHQENFFQYNSKMKDFSFIHFIQLSLN